MSEIRPCCSSQHAMKSVSTGFWTACILCVTMGLVSLTSACLRTRATQPPLPPVSSKPSVGSNQSKTAASSPLPIPSIKSECPSQSIWTDPSEHYVLPSWAPRDLIWVQPADTVYVAKGQPTETDTAQTAWIQQVGPNNSGSLYCDWLLVMGGTPPYSYTVSGAPTGLVVDSASGLYGGRATKTGTYSVTFCATDAAGSQICAAPRTQIVCNGPSDPCPASVD